MELETYLLQIQPYSLDTFDPTDVDHYTGTDKTEATQKKTIAESRKDQANMLVSACQSLIPMLQMYPGTTIGTIDPSATTLASMTTTEAIIMCDAASAKLSLYSTNLTAEIASLDAIIAAASESKFINVASFVTEHNEVVAMYEQEENLL